MTLARLSFVTLSLAVSALVASWASAAPPLGVSARVFVTRVVDGDTVDVEIRIPLRVRLIDCWAPEKYEGKIGPAATQSMTTMADKQWGVLFVPTQEAQSLTDVLTFDRVLGKIWIDGNTLDISERQVRKNLASRTKGAGLGE
jgi:endonuclease YncB( thermonuclease family)